ncbi:MAG: DODA-type extradiol aromatic ring-opening family dioxygenase [Dongiaceae bacterium]
MTALPSVFVSHGAPTLVFEDNPARQFMAGLGAMLGAAKSILCVSAHWDTPGPMVSGVVAPETIHDFHGFPAELYRLRYPAPGAPDLARRAAKLLDGAGIGCAVDGARGLDHGAWNPMMLIYPTADLPVTQLSIQARRDPVHHLAVGRALRPLREDGVLILASGGAVHNLRQFGIDREKPAPWASSFDDWLADRIAAGDEAALAGYRATRPDGKLAHPTDEHFLPLFVAMGACGGKPGRALHRSFAHGSLSMASYAWD